MARVTKQVMEEDEASERGELREWDAAPQSEPEPPAMLPGGRYWPWDGPVRP